MKLHPLDNIDSDEADLSFDRGARYAMSQEALTEDLRERIGSAMLEAFRSAFLAPIQESNVVQEGSLVDPEATCLAVTNATHTVWPSLAKMPLRLECDGYNRHLNGISPRAHLRVLAGPVPYRCQSQWLVSPLEAPFPTTLAQSDCLPMRTLRCELFSKIHINSIDYEVDVITGALLAALIPISCGPSSYGGSQGKTLWSCMEQAALQAYPRVRCLIHNEGHGDTPGSRTTYPNSAPNLLTRETDFNEFFSSTGHHWSEQSQYRKVRRVAHEAAPHIVLVVHVANLETLVVQIEPSELLSELHWKENFHCKSWGGDIDSNIVEAAVENYDFAAPSIRKILNDERVKIRRSKDLGSTN